MRQLEKLFHNDLSMQGARTGWCWKRRETSDFLKDLPCPEQVLEEQASLKNVPCPACSQGSLLKQGRSDYDQPESESGRDVLMWK